MRAIFNFLRQKNTFKVGDFVVVLSPCVGIGRIFEIQEFDQSPTLYGVTMRGVYYEVEADKLQKANKRYRLYATILMLIENGITSEYYLKQHLGWWSDSSFNDLMYKMDQVGLINIENRVIQGKDQVTHYVKHYVKA